MGENIRFILNDEEISTSHPGGMVLLDFIRNHKKLVGTKIGCREGDCGACTVLAGFLEEGRMTYRAMTSCLMPLGNAAGKHIVTIEGLNQDTLTPVQQAIVDQGGSQCGFCSPGFVMALTGFCLNAHQDAYEKAIAAIDGNMCRCTGYKSLEKAASQIEKAVAGIDQDNPVSWLVQRGFLPEYFAGIPARLASISVDAQKADPDEGSGTCHVGGGTDLYVQRPGEMTNEKIQHLAHRPELKGVRREAGRCFIGGATTTEAIRQSPVIREIFPEIEALMKRIASTPIRNMATLGGNIVNASPIGDMTILFIALHSDVLLRRHGRRRSLPLKDFYKGYKTLDKAPAEIVEAVIFNIPPKDARIHFEKVSKRTHVDIASVNSAFCLEMDKGVIVKAGLSAGGVAPVPLYLENASSYLAGRKITEKTIQKAAEKALGEISPIDDIRGSAGYKRLLLRHLIYAHFAECFPSDFQAEALL